jgi:dynein heavy chain
MYQNSLQWFASLFENAVNDSTPSQDPVERCKILNDFFTHSLYENVCRGLFEKHKLLFSFLLTVKILFGDKKIDPTEWRYFLAGPSGEIDVVPNPTDWLDELEWIETYKQIYGMNELPAFKGIDEYFIEYHKRFRKIFDSPNAHEEPLPGEWNDKLDSFQKMIVLKSIRSDKMMNAIQNFISEKMGTPFIEPPTFDLKKSFRDSSHKMPLIFVLSPGTDPVADFKKFAQEMSMTERMFSISLGQGQAKKAEKLISDGKDRGDWILLANCHLSISWMPSLEQIVEQLNDEINSDFRMWLTSMPHPKFPVSTLQNSVKMTLEPPQGLRANLRRSYMTFDNQELNDCKKPEEFKMLLFNFCFFHAIVQDRRKFGPIGWNIPYEFTTEDLTVCKRQLKIFLDEYDKIPYKVLNYLGAQINYGGRVTDDKDKRLIQTIMQIYITPQALEVGHKLSESGTYICPKPGNQEEYIEYISQLPLNPHPEVFGMHENAEITTNQSNTRNTLLTILSIQPRSSSAGGKTRDQILTEIAVNIETKTPPLFDLEDVMTKYPTEYTESMNTVLTQEVGKYNRLLALMIETLADVQKALVGEVVMSEDLEKLGNSLFDNLVPDMWADVGFLSLKPLASWIQDLNDRVKFLKEWIENGTPAVFWISGFFFPQAFLTGTLQNYARKHIIAIDELTFQFKIYDDISPQDVKEKPEDGCYVYGLYLEGARWNANTHLLDDSRPKQLYSDMPMIWFLPKQNRKIPETGIYNCPVYKVLSRTGTLSTTGHSTNYVLMMELPTKESENKWIVAGVAAFLALRY